MTRPAASPALAWLRDARWLTAKRAAVYGGLLGLVPAAYFAVGVLRVVHDAGPGGATDFLGFYAASTQALLGEAAAAWNPGLHAAAQQAVMPSGDFPYFYPPPFLLLTSPLALAPYKVAFSVWMLLTIGLCLFALLRYRAGPWPAILAICLLAPAAVIAVVTGQTAFLITALFAAAGLLLDRRPALAGILVAGLAMKPQLGLVVLPALVAARRWRTIAFAAFAGVIGVLASGIGLGWASWPAFLSALSHAASALHQGEIQRWQVQSVYGSMQLIGVPGGLAMAVQVLAGIAAVLAVLRVCARRAGGRAEASAMAAAAPLATPYVFVADFTILLLPLVWILSESRRDGFLAWEKLALLAAYVAPALSAYFGQSFGMNIGPLAPLIMLAAVMRRAAATPQGTAKITAALASVDDAAGSTATSPARSAAS